MSLQLGTASYTGQNTQVRYWHHHPIEDSCVRVGNYCSIANNVAFFVDGNHRVDYASTYPFLERGGAPRGVKTGWGKGAPRVGHDVWIGNDCTIMSGVVIGTGSVVGAGSVVSRDVPPYAIVAGNPAAVKRYRFSQEIIDQLLQSEWWNLPRDAVLEVLAPLAGDVRAWIEAAERCKRPTTP